MIPNPDPVPSATEDELARWLDRMLAGADPGPVPPTEAAELRRLLRAAGLLELFAASVREHLSDRIETTIDLPRNSSAIPDPFPGEYRLLSVLGRGGFGTVWLADDLNLGVKVALKTLRAANDAHAMLLRQEARVLAGIRHPNVVPVFALRTAGADAYLVMRYIPGGSLAQRVKQTGPLPWALAGRYMADVSDALVRVHAAGLIHRDIKPANVLWDSDTDEAVLTDFGLTVRLNDAATPAGTPLYMAPEAFTGEQSAASDVYGLAATLFALATGTPPYQGTSTTELVELAIRGLPASEERLAGVPETLERVVRAGLEPNPSRRPSTAQFASALRGMLNQSLADAFPMNGENAGPVNLRVLVGRRDAFGGYAPVGPSAPPRVLTRDLKRVPPAPDRVELRTGDRVRVQVVADRAGYLTVFNVGPTGNLNLLVPDAGAVQWIESNRPLDILDVELTPPAGRERVFAVWTREPLPTTVLQGIVERDASALPRPYRATRDMQALSESMRQHPPGDWHAMVLELDHRPL